MTAERDTVDAIVDAWQRERPEIDMRPMHVFSRIKRLSRQLDRVRAAAFAECGLELWEFDVLSALRRAGSPYRLAPKTLLEQNLVSSGTMTNRIDRLVERGLVVREQHEHDRRSIAVEMTAEGRDLVDHAIEALMREEQRLLAGFTDDERAALAGLLRTLTASLS